MGLGAIFRRISGIASPRKAPDGLDAGLPGPSVDFAVVDVETTGLYPGGHDRILEIGIVKTGWTGEMVEEYVTLVNPQRDVGPTSIHGITARDIASAPPFEEVAGDVADRLSGVVLAGHNVDFDLRFINAELARLGSGLGTPPSVCTLALCGYLVPPPLNGRLSSCCAAIGIRHDQAHSALSDAHATAQVLHAIIRNMGCTGLEELWTAPSKTGSYRRTRRTLS